MNQTRILSEMTPTEAAGCMMKINAEKNAIEKPLLGCR